ncbi:hypothetical protein PVL29_014363 [Vitis rotundifolia]|uniref:Uncharacterized protein n=1 Tax=Vitis rotundifolia TaxID=103349 RepID=A0AA39DLV0_VITRO|nr:hypothetical protein PVL29_014363 [Vitis rotundifolia]
MVLPSMPKIKGKGLSFMGNCGLLVAENLKVILSSPIQSPSSYFPPSCGLTSSFLSPSVPNLPSLAIQSLIPLENRVNSEFFFKKDDDGSVGQTSDGILNLLTESVNPFLPKPISPIKASNLVTISQGVTADSPSGEFQIVGCLPGKWQKCVRF